MLATWLKEVKETADQDSLGMILVHEGIVRGTSKTGARIKGMQLSYDKEKLERKVNELRAKEGIVDIRVWINGGKLKIGDDIMLALVPAVSVRISFPYLWSFLPRSRMASSKNARSFRLRSNKP